MLMTLIYELKIAGVLPAVENVEKRPLFSTSPFLQCIFHLPEKMQKQLFGKQNGQEILEIIDSA